MRKIIIILALFLFTISLMSCKKTEIKGLYQFNKYSENKSEADKKSIMVTINDKGGYTITLKSKHVTGLNPGAFDTVVSSYIDEKVRYDKNIKLGKKIRFDTRSTAERLQQELIFEKNAVKWRWAVIESYLPRKDFEKENIEDKKYFILEKYIVE